MPLSQRIVRKRGSDEAVKKGRKEVKDDDDDDHNEDDDVSSAAATKDRYTIRSGSVAESASQAMSTSVASSGVSDDDDDDDDVSSASSGTSSATDFSEILEDDFDMALISTAINAAHPPAGWMDSACGWLDKPMCLLGFGKETSLLRQSKGRARTALSQMRINDRLSAAGMKKLSTIERRNLRLNRKGLAEAEAAAAAASGGAVDTYSGKGTESGAEKPDDATEVTFFTAKHIQPGKNAGATGTSNSESLKSFDLSRTVAEDYNSEQQREDEEGTRSSPINLHSMTSDEAPEDEAQLDGNQISQKRNQISGETLDRVLTDSPGGSTAFGAKSEAATATGVTTVRVPSLDIPESESIKSGSGSSTQPQPVDLSHVVVQTVKNASTRSARSIVKKDDMAPTRRSKSLPRTKVPSEITDLTDLTDSTLDRMRVLPAAPSMENLEDKKTNDTAKETSPKKIEIINVLGDDNQEPWTPISAKHPDTSKRGRRTKRSDLPDERSHHSRDPSPSFTSRRTAANQGRDPSPSGHGRTKLGSKSTTDLWREEEAKLANRSTHRPYVGKLGAATILSNPHNADDLWDEEEKKLHIIPPTTNIFDDPEAREAFLGHRRGRLQDIGMGETHRSRSQSRRRRLVEALQGDEVSEDNSKRVSSRSSRPPNLDDRRPPTPDKAFAKVTQIRSRSRSKSRDGRHQYREDTTPVRNRQASSMVEDGNIGSDDASAAPSRVNRSKDLVAVRSIEDSQRLRATRAKEREGQFGETRDPIDSHEYMDEDSDARPSRSYHRREEERVHRQSKSRDRSRMVVDLADMEPSEVISTRRKTNDIRDVRDDREFRHSLRSRRGPANSHPVEEWPDYETVISATKELKKLERKIEKQLRTVRRETRGHEWDNQSHVSSKEIRKLEKQLAQKLKRENEKRGAKLKRIKRRTPKKSESSFMAMADDSDKKQQHQQKQQHQEHQHQQQQHHQDRHQEEEVTKEPTTPAKTPVNNKSFSEKVDDFRERSKFDQLRVLRSSRYLRSSSRGQRPTAGPGDGDV